MMQASTHVQSQAHARLHGLDLPDHVIEWFWDGKLESMNALKANFGDCGHLCLEHAKRNASARYIGGYKKLVPNVLEMIAFQLPLVFHLAAGTFIETFLDDNQDTTNLTTARQGGAFVATDGTWSGSYQSNFRKCKPGYSTFTPQVVEAGWKSEDVIHGDTKHAPTDTMLSNTQRLMRAKHGDGDFDKIFTIIVEISNTKVL